LSWNCFPLFDSSPNGEPLIGERIRQVADFRPLEAGGWKLTAVLRSTIEIPQQRLVIACLRAKAPPHHRLWDREPVRTWEGGD
jgi:hypothetical protein